MSIATEINSRGSFSGFLSPAMSASMIEKSIKGVDFLSKLNIRQAKGAVEQRTQIDGILDAGWVDVDAGQKKFDKVTSETDFLYTEEIAVMSAISKNTVRDVNGDILGAIRRAGENGIGTRLAKTILYGGMAGYPKPSTLPPGLVPSAIAAGNVIEYGSVADADIADYVSGLYGLVEADDYEVTDVAIDRSLKAVLRNARDKQGNFLYQPSMQVGTPNALYGVNAFNVKRNQWDASKALMLAFNADNIDVLVWQQIRFEIFDQATVVLADGSLFSAAQRDSYVLRLDFRAGYGYKDVEAGTFPAAILTPED